MIDFQFQWVIYSFLPLLLIGIGIYALFKAKTKQNKKRVIEIIAAAIMGILFFYLSQQGYI